MRLRLALTVTGLLLAATPASASAADVAFGGSLGNTYAPKDVTITKGESITWTGNFDGHPLYSNTNAFPAKTSGATPYTVTFDTPGTFAYYCSFHSDKTNGMVGRVVVTDAAAPPPAETPPPGPTGPPANDGPPGYDLVEPTASVKLPARLTPRTSTLRVTTSEPGEASATLKAGKTTLAKGLRSFPAAGTRGLKLTLTKAGRARLARSASVKATLAVVVSDRFANAVVVRRTITLKRR